MATISERKKKDGSISYRAEIRIKRGGKVVYREAETWAKRKLAEQWAAQREGELSNPAVLAAAISGRDEKPITVAQLIERYIAEVYPLKPWGKTKSDTLRQLSGSEFGSLIAGEVVAKDIIRHCRTWGAGPSTMNQHYIFIRGVFSVARELLGCDVRYEEVDIAQRTMVKLGIISKGGERNRRPTIDEITRLVSHCYGQRLKWGTGRFMHRDDLIPMDKVIVFAMLSGRRQEEICRITRADTDYEKQRVLVRQMKHPSKKQTNDVWCYVPDEAWRVMLSMPQREGDDRWFPYFSRTLGDRFRAVQKDLGMWSSDDDADNLRFHDLRHECASWLFERDGWNGERWDVPRVASVTGHQNWNSLKRYTQIENSVPNNKWSGWKWLEMVRE